MPNIIITIVSYFLFDLGEDSFYSAAPTMYVRNYGKMFDFLIWHKETWQIKILVFTICVGKVWNLMKSRGQFKKKLWRIGEKLESKQSLIWPLLLSHLSFSRNFWQLYFVATDILLLKCWIVSFSGYHSIGKRHLAIWLFFFMHLHHCCLYFTACFQSHVLQLEHFFLSLHSSKTLQKMISLIWVTRYRTIFILEWRNNCAISCKVFRKSNS